MDVRTRITRSFPTSSLSTLCYSNLLILLAFRCRLYSKVVEVVVHYQLRTFAPTERTSAAGTDLQSTATPIVRASPFSISFIFRVDGEDWGEPFVLGNRNRTPDSHAFLVVGIVLVLGLYLEPGFEGI